MKYIRVMHEYFSRIIESPFGCSLQILIWTVTQQLMVLGADSVVIKKIGGTVYHNLSNQFVKKIHRKS